ncbi:MAG: hypothetical protein LQ350_005711 [Teloschistes chrysophthalmus]|nr:MAG: hypothetical protein LQ350_005711 [Niorma chrysophthalma]
MKFLANEALTIEAASRPSQFSLASIRKEFSNEDKEGSKLGFSRAYSISLSPQQIYTRSNLVPALVSSKCYRQLEFLAVGSWWIHDGEDEIQAGQDGEGGSGAKSKRTTCLRKIPGSREDVFEDKSISLRSTRSLMKILKLATDPEIYPTIIKEHGHRPFPEYLTSECKLDPKLQAPLLALTLSWDSPAKTTVAFALPRLHRHLTSIGIFGPGFGAVIPKWGGLAEIAQVACRAGAVGGGVYVLKKGIEAIERSQREPTSIEATSRPLTTVRLAGGDTVKARLIVGTPTTIPKLSEVSRAQRTAKVEIIHLTAIISWPLTSLFPPPAEGSPSPAAVVVVMPPSSLQLPDGVDESDVPLIYLNVHSSDTGECPDSQCIIYTSTSLANPSASDILSSALKTLLSTIPTEGETEPEILWSMTYTQRHTLPSPTPPSASSNKPGLLPLLASIDSSRDLHHGILYLNELGPSLALEDEVLRDVRGVWERITVGDAEGADRGFMQFVEREGMGGGELDEEM